MNETLNTGYTFEVPLGNNGYAAVARPAIRITASEVRLGDILILDGYVTEVHDITLRDLGQGLCIWPVYHIKGHCNIIRFPHEIVSVIRSTPNE